MTDLDDTPPWDTGPSFSAASLEKLTASALTEEYARSMGVRPVTDQRDLPPEFADNLGLCTVPGMLIPWRDPRDPERIVWQYRPDHPVEPAYKYVFPEGQHQPLGLIKAGSGDRVAIVEGTMQGLAFSRYIGDVPVYAIPGCDGWSKNKNATESLTVVEGKDVVIFLDADAGTNASVYDAGHELARFSKIYGATGAFFARAPGRGVNGIDDFLGSAAEDKRAELLARLLDNPEMKPAPRKPPGKPKAKSVYGLATAAGLPDVNDTALGTQWADASLNHFRWLTDDESWMACREGRWERVGTSVPASSVMKFLSHVANQYIAASKREDGDKREKLEETGRQLLSSAKRTSVRQGASDYDVTHVRRAELDRHPRKFCVANGVLDLETLEVTPHDPDLLLTTGSSVEYREGAPCNRFDAFLEDVLPDEELRGYVLRIFAMAMYGEVRDHILPVFIGDGRNGKGTLMRIMHGVFGSHAEVIEASALLVRKYEKHEEEIARLAGKRLITTEETGRESVWNVPRINSWTGGDRLKGRWMGGNSFSFNPSHTLVMATNHRPNVGQGEKAFWARYREIPFNVDFSDRIDMSLEPWILENELPGVLNRLIEAGRSYLSQGLQEPTAVTMATLDAKVDADHLARFCAEHIAVTHDHDDPADRILNNDLAEFVAKWWSQNVRGEASPGARTFGKAMRQALGFPADSKNPKKIGKGQDCKLTWTGVRWLEGGSEDQDEGGLPLEDAETPNSADLSKGNENQGDPNQGDPKKWSAASAARSAARSAELVDQEGGETPGQRSESARSAESAVLVRRRDTDLEDTQETPVDHGLKKVVLGVTGANVQTRQTWQSEQSGGVIFDLETDSAHDLYTAADPAKFIRLVGATPVINTDGSEPRIDLTVAEMIEHVKQSPRVIGHNIMHFDLPALARVPDSGIDILAMARERRIFDTMIADSVLNPIQNESRPGEVGRAMKYYGLDASAERHGVPGKTHDLKKHVKQHYDGDFNAIEWGTDTELQDYLRGDVAATRAVYERLDYSHAHPALPEPTREYLWREHRVHAIAAVMGMNGFTVDEPLLRERYEAGVKRKQELTATLVREYAIPTVKADGKPSKSPAATKEGKAALEAAFRSLGVNPDTDITRTVKGAISFGGDAMRELAEKFSDRPNAEKIAALCEVVADSAGIRTVYGTALEHMKRHPDGTYKVHPQVATFQASGRWSVTKPGLTVFGKRGGKVVERAVFVAAPGNVLMAIDLSQVDARAVAGHCQDPAYMDLFGFETDGTPRDSHMEVAEMVWGVRDAEHRHMAKAIGHGWNYGMGIQKIVVQAGVSEETARQFDQTMKRRFPLLVAWKDEVREMAGRPGAYLDNGFGRLMRPDPERAYNQGPALFGQGTARDIMMDCLLKIDNKIPKVIHMLRAQVHDEAIFELPESLAPDIKKFIEECFTGEFRGVPIIAEGGHFGKSWASCY